jgi:hypothetical protein
MGVTTVTRTAMPMRMAIVIRATRMILTMGMILTAGTAMEMRRITLHHEEMR